MPNGFYIGPLFVHFYGVILMTGALAGALLAERGARKRGQSSDMVWDAFIWLLIGGIIGARIWHILTPPPSFVEQGITTSFYLTHPLDALNMRKGGLGIPGAIIGGAIALYWFCRNRKIDFWMWTDIAAPGLALGQAIGRWGNYVNQEVYGAPTSLPWAIYIEPLYRIPGFEQFERFHPLFLYESLWSLANMAFLLWVGHRYSSRLKNGDIFLMYLIIYPVGRFLLEFLRLDASMVAGINFNQTFMLIVALVASAALFFHLRKPASELQPMDDAGNKEENDLVS